MKFKYILSLLIITNFAAVAQQVIEFYSLSGSNTLTQEDVNTILENEWLGAEFSAKIHDDITVIGKGAFIADVDFNNGNPINKYLVNINTNNVEMLDTLAFAFCGKLLDTIELPAVTKIMTGAFSGTFCSTMFFGEKFTTTTEIIFEEIVFMDGWTTVIDLVLSEYVTPAPDLTKREWQDYMGTDANNYFPLKWKSITIFSGISQELDNTKIYCLSDNTYYIDKDNISALLLFDVLGNQLRKYDDNFVDLNNFPSSVYFLKCFVGKRIKTFKIIKN